MYCPTSKPCSLHMVIAGNLISFAGCENVLMSTELGFSIHWLIAERTKMDASVNPHPTMTIQSNRSGREPAETQYWNPCAEVFWQKSDKTWGSDLTFSEKTPFFLFPRFPSCSMVGAWTHKSNCDLTGAVLESKGNRHRMCTELQVGMTCYFKSS